GGATLTVAGVAPVDGAPVNVDLAVGETVIVIAVTAADGVTAATHTVTVTRAAAPEPPLEPVGPPLLAAVYNGDFELDDALSGWGQRGGILDVAAGLTGVRAARLSSDTTSTKWIDQPLGVTAGAWYEASARLAPDGGVDAAWVRVAWYASADGSGSQLATADSAELAGGAGATRTTTGVVQAPDGAASARVRAVMRPAGAEPSVLVVDDVAFAAAPEPAEDLPPADGGADEDAGATPPDRSVDAVLNGDFEAADPLDAWAKHGGEFASYALDGGGHVATLTSSTTSTKWVDQVVAITPGRAYLLSASLTADAGVEAVWMRLAWYASADGSGSQLETADGDEVAGPGAGLASVGPAIAPAAAVTARVRIMLRPLAADAAAITIDDVVLTADAGGDAPDVGTPDLGTPDEEVGGGTGGPPLAEVVFNGDFEAVSPLDGWSAYGATLTAISGGSDGSSTAALLASETGSTKWLEQPVLVNAGAWYEARAWLAANPGVDAAWVRLAWYGTPDASGAQLATADSPMTTSGDAPAQYSTGVAQAPAGALSARLRVMLRPTGDAPASVVVDDAALLVAAPAPASGFVPAPILDGAIYNGTFEADDPLAGWSAQRTEASFVDGEFGRSALITSASSSTKWIEQLVRVQPGGWYIANAVLAPDAGVAAAWVRIAWYGPADGGGSQLNTDDSPELPGGVTAGLSTGPQQAPFGASSARVRLMLRPHGDSAARLVADFVTLAPTVAPPPKPRNTNRRKPPPAPILRARLFNTTFTVDGAGDLLGWSKYGGTLELRRLATDAWAAALVSESTSTKWLEQRIAVDAGDWYEASATVTPDPFVASTWLRLSWYASDDATGPQIASVDSPALEAPGPAAADGVRQAAVASTEPVTITTGSVAAPDAARSARLKVMLRPLSAARTTLLVYAADFAIAEPAATGANEEEPTRAHAEVTMRFEALTNGDFESDPGLLAWNRHGGEADVGVTTPSAGRTAGLRSMSRSTKWLDQRVLVTPGGRYRVSARLMPDRGVDAAWLRVAWYATPDAGGSQIGADDGPALPGGA
ncbi:MAG: cadherin-like beta sandwich domain-containing protein, partial [Chloroflexi bacterium]|nr:cadherin-like beta sandwich domain-containing protein [Chloroflexota bacterium]